MANAWIAALRKWNEGKGMWCFPKKGTKEYDEVKALMPPRAEKAPRKSEAPKDTKAAELRREARELMKDAKAETSQEKKEAILRGLKEVKTELKEHMKSKAPTKNTTSAPAPEPAKPKEKRVVKVSKKVFEAAAPAPKPEPSGSASSSEEEMKKKASAAADAAVNKFVMSSKSENRNYLASRRNAIAKQVYERELEKLRSEASEKKKDKVSAIIAQRVQKKKKF